jgi:PEP-CTERM motif
MYRRSRKFVSVRLASLANICGICLLFWIVTVGSAKADDLFWGSTDGSKLVLYDASSNALLPETYSGQSHTPFGLINTASNRSYAYDFQAQGIRYLGSIVGAGDNRQSFAPVPEPSIGVMFGLGLLGLIGFQRWRRRSIAR